MSPKTESAATKKWYLKSRAKARTKPFDINRESTESNGSPKRKNRGASTRQPRLSQYFRKRGKSTLKFDPKTSRLNSPVREAPAGKTGKKPKQRSGSSIPGLPLPSAPKNRAHNRKIGNGRWISSAQNSWMQKSRRKSAE